MSLTEREKELMRGAASGCISVVQEGIRIDVGELAEQMTERAGWGNLTGTERQQKIEAMLLLLAGETPSPP